MTISKNAERLLRKISQVNSFPAELAEKYGENAICALLKYKYIEEVIDDINPDTCQLLCTAYTITDSGCAYLRTLTSDKIRFTIPLLLSAISLVISVLSIILSPYFSAFFSHLYGI